MMRREYLVTLVLEGKGVPKPYPGRCKGVVHAGGLAKISASCLKLSCAEVVAANPKPGYPSVRVFLHQSATRHTLLRNTDCIYDRWMRQSPNPEVA